MRRILILFILIGLLCVPVSGLEYTAPEAPEDALELMPKEEVSFAGDLWFVIRSALVKLQPAIPQALGICGSLLALVMLLAILKSVPGNSASIADLAGVLTTAVLLLQATGSMISLASETVRELSEYGKLLLPVMAAALASQGGITSSTAIYAGTAIFDTVLMTAIGKALVPLLYIFLTVAVAAAATGEKLLSDLRDLIKWAVTWFLKTSLYVFTGYMSITGAVSGATDTATLKATKLTLSSLIPVVGSILSDASESVIVSAGLVKNAVGVYGMVAIIAIWIWPFLQIGIQYLLLKLTAAICGIFDIKPVQSLVSAFTTAMGLLLGMIGAVCILLLISAVCFMKGVS